jgi:L-rhamnose isomerase
MQLTTSDRALLFWAAYLPARLLFASHFARLYSSLARLVAALVGARWALNENFASYGFFGGPAWWSSVRPWHGALWLIYAATGERDALLADVLLAALAWTH